MANNTRRSPQQDVLMHDIMHEQQFDPGSARPEEFEVLSGDAAHLEMPFHGQRGKTKAQERALLEEGKPKTGSAPKRVKVVSQGRVKPTRAVKQK